MMASQFNTIPGLNACSQVIRSKPEYAIIDKRFETFLLGNVALKRLATGFDWAEGPVWFGDAGCLLFSDIPNNIVYRWSPEVGISSFRYPSNFSNGHYRDMQGRLITCEHGKRRVTRTEHDGTISVLADNFAGKRLNSPNDVIVKSDGTIWFTDPIYGIHSSYEGFKAKPELPSYVYCFEPNTKKLLPVLKELDCPNGLAFSPDEKFLYISVTGSPYQGIDHTGIFRFKVAELFTKKPDYIQSGTLDCGVPDGFRMDTEGNLWTSAGDGVYCYSSELEILGKIYLPEVVSNVCFGGRDKQILFITATTSIYSIALNRKGAQHP